MKTVRTMKTVRLIALATVAALVLVACEAADEPPATDDAPPPDTTEEEAADTDAPPPPADSTTLIVAEDVPPTSFDPTQSALIRTWLPWQLSYETLIEVQVDGSIEPVLATDWEISDDALTYTFTLREGVTFHNGEPFTADDVVYSFERMQEVGVPYAQARFPMLESVTALDTHVVEFVLNAIDAGFMSNLGNPFPVGGAILNEVAGQATAHAVFMVGTGPYKMVSYAPERELVLVRNDDYWGNAPAVENLIIRYMPDQSAQVAALRAGEVHVMFPNAESFRALEGTDIQIDGETSANVIRLDISTVHEAPLDDIRVRRAIALAIDRDAIVEGALLGEGAPAAHLPPGLAYSIPLSDLPNHTYDPDQARALLAEAGYPDGLDMTLEHLSGYGTYLDRYVEILQGQLADVGINAEIVPNETPAWLDKLINANYDITPNEVSYQADPIWYMLIREGRHGPTPPEIAAAQAELQAAHPDELIEKLQEFQRLQAELVWPNLGIAARNAWIAYRPEVSNVDLDFTLSRKLLFNVTIDQ